MKNAASGNQKDDGSVVLLSAPPLTSAMNLVLACLRTDCDDANAVLLEDAGRDVDWREFTDLCTSHRIYPTVYEVLRCRGGIVPDDVLSRLRQLSRKNVMRSMALSGELVRLTEILRQNGIRVMALKGPALAQQVYGNAGRRASCDLDLLIEPHQRMRVGQILAREGYWKLDWGLTPKQSDTLHNCSFVSCYHRNDPDITIDLHWALSLHPHTGIALDDLWDESSTEEIDGYPVRVLTGVTLLLYLAAHGAKHSWGELRYLLDLVKAQACLTDAQWAQAVKRAGEWRLESIVGQTMIMSNLLLPCKWPRIFGEYMGRRNARVLTRVAMAIASASGQGEAAQDAPSPPRFNYLCLRYRWLLSGGWLNRLLVVLHLFRPSLGDYRCLCLPDRLHFLYYLLRPLTLCLRKSRIVRVSGR